MCWLAFVCVVRGVVFAVGFRLRFTVRCVACGVFVFCALCVVCCVLCDVRCLVCVTRGLLMCCLLVFLLINMCCLMCIVCWWLCVGRCVPLVV